MAEKSGESRVRALILASRRFNRCNMLRVGGFTDLDIKPSEMFLMANLRKEENGEGLKPSEIAAHLGVSAGNVTQLITSLEARGLVLRAHDTDDRRAVRVCLTTEGEAAMNAARESMRVFYSGLDKYLGPEDAERLTGLLNRAVDYFTEAYGIDSHCHAGALEPRHTT